jgi:mannose-6-phosphate isomerase-like protein (cupin superfamily)
MNATITPETDGGTEAPERIWFLGGLVTVHIPAHAGLGFSLVESRVPYGEQPPLHLHRTDDEGFYLLEGNLTLWVGSDRIELEPGQFALAPHGVPHTYRVQSEQGARWLVTSSDASFDRFVRAYGEPATEDRLPDPAPPDAERLTALAEEHGIEILGPPGALPS